MGIKSSRACFRAPEPPHMEFRGHCLPEASKLTWERQNSGLVSVSVYGKSKDLASSLYKFLAGTRLPPFTPHPVAVALPSALGGAVCPDFWKRKLRYRTMLI